MIVELGFLSTQVLSLSLTLLSQLSEPDVVIKSFRTFHQSKINQSGCLNPSPVQEWTVETRTETEAQSLPWVRGWVKL